MSRHRVLRFAVGAIFGLMVVACSSPSSPSEAHGLPARAAPGSTTSVSSASSAKSTSSASSSIAVSYAVTSRSSPADHASIIYTNPADGVEFVIQAPDAWSETWQVPARKSTLLRVEVVGPAPASNSCAIRVNGKRINHDAGKAFDDPDTPVICLYAWPVENT
jgi:hypothetical protein